VLKTICGLSRIGQVCRDGQADDRIIADGGDAFQCDVTSALDGPFIILFEQNGADEACDGGLVGEDADDLGAALDLAFQSLERVCAVQFGAVL